MNAHRVIETLHHMRDIGMMDAESADLLARKVAESVKFVLDFGEFPKFDQERMEAEVRDLRLPFPLCCFEVPDVGLLLAREAGEDTILVHPFYRLPGGAWGTVPLEVLLYLDKTTASVGTLSEDPEIQNDLETAAADAKQSAWMTALVSFMVRGLSVLNCSNVVTVENPAPAALNKKRSKAGKVPLFSYRTLHLAADVVRTVQKGGAPAAERAAPRLHLRRGHIRRLPSGAKVWVRACMVGDAGRGFHFKDYHVHA